MFFSYAVALVVVEVYGVFHLTDWDSIKLAYLSLMIFLSGKGPIVMTSIFN